MHVAGGTDVGSTLAIRGLRKSYGDLVALDGVELDVAPGEVLGLLGPNGAGKTTLVSIVAGLLQPDAGEVRVGGVEVDPDRLDTKRSIGIAPQELGLYLTLDVRRNLRFFGRLAGVAQRELDARVEEVAAALELTHLLDRRVQTLSGGEQRRAHTAVAILGRPALLLLDEPTAGVDVSTRNSLLEVVRDLARAGCAVCYTTHYLPEVEALGASVAILEQGRIIARGDVRELIASSGGAVVEIQLEGPVPDAAAALGSVDAASGTLRIRTPQPGVAVTQALASIGPARDRVRSIEIVQPSLESVYLSLTGRRFDATGAEETDDAG